MSALEGYSLQDRSSLEQVGASIVPLPSPCSREDQRTEWSREVDVPPFSLLTLKHDALKCTRIFHFGQTEWIFLALLLGQPSLALYLPVQEGTGVWTLLTTVIRTTRTMMTTLKKRIDRPLDEEVEQGLCPEVDRLDGEVHLLLGLTRHRLPTSTSRCENPLQKNVRELLF